MSCFTLVHEVTPWIDSSLLSYQNWSCWVSEPNASVVILVVMNSGKRLLLNTYLLVSWSRLPDRREGTNTATLLHRWECLCTWTLMQTIPSLEGCSHTLCKSVVSLSLVLGHLVVVWYSLFFLSHLIFKHLLKLPSCFRIGHFQLRDILSKGYFSCKILLFVHRCCTGLLKSIEFLLNMPSVFLFFRLVVSFLNIKLIYLILLKTSSFHSLQVTYLLQRKQLWVKMVSVDINREFLTLVIE